MWPSTGPFDQGSIKAPAPEVEDDGRLPGRQGGGQELGEKAQGLFGGARIKPRGARRRDGVVAGELQVVRPPGAEGDG